MGARVVRWALTLAAAWALQGCAVEWGYLGRSVAGHWDLATRARPIDDWLNDSATDPALRERLEKARRIRAFASAQLGLPDNASYTRYADLGRDAAVWNVVATPELSLELRTWCHPVVGCVGYRGYFTLERARATARELQAQGLEVWVYPVPAYSTLGWTNWVGGDPLLNTFLRGHETELARLIFHELSHQQVYAADDTAFNESYATAVERLGLQRWLQSSGEPEAWDAWLSRERRQREFQALTAAARDELRDLYRQDLSDADKRRRKQEVLASLRERYRLLRDGSWGGDTRYDAWFERVNNAALALQGSYLDLVPAFEALFRGVEGDFTRFHAEVRRLAALPASERHRELRGWADR